MSNKSYNQYCAIAHALDTVGERWTLVIIRNLLLGHKRFSDLMKGLPGISTNILTERLKLLEEKGVLTTRFLPPPAASTVYQLTESGYALADTLAALARWGSLTLGEPKLGQLILNEGIAFMVLGVFRRSDFPSVTLTCNFRVQDEQYDHVFGVKLSPIGMELSEEALPTADVEVEIALEALSGLSSGRTGLQALTSVRFKGTQAHINELIQWIDER